MEEKLVKSAEIKDGKLILNNTDHLYLEGICNLASFRSLKEYAEDIDEAIFSFAQLGAAILTDLNLDEKVTKEIGSRFPDARVIYTLKELSTSLKRIEE